MITMKIDGVKNSEYLNDFYISSFQNPIPEKTEKRIKILGSQGTKLIGLRYNDRILKLDCYLINQNLREELRTLINFLKIDDMVLINIDNDPKMFYYGNFKQITNLDIKNYRGSNIGIEYTVEPEIYKIINDLIDIETINTIADIELLTENIDYIKSINPFIEPI